LFEYEISTKTDEDDSESCGHKEYSSREIKFGEVYECGGDECPYSKSFEYSEDPRREFYLTCLIELECGENRKD